MNKTAKMALITIAIMAIIVAVFSIARPVRSPSAKLCRDGIDNDEDGLTDYPADPGCSDKNDISELGNNECDEGIDNDGDCYTDTADS